jgi:transcriptional regulator EpsA
MSELPSRLPADALNVHEQSCLLHALTSALDLCELAGLRRWAGGPLQALLPHAVLVCVRLGSDGEPLRIECLGDHAPSLHAALCDPAQGLAMAAYRLWRPHAAPLLLHDSSHGQPVPQRLAALGLANALAHGTPALPGGSTFFLLAGLPARPAAHHVQLLRLLVPHLHLALQRVCVAPGPAQVVPRALSPREAQVLRWLREGKSNDEIGTILGISGLTVKNHLQRLYKLLGVSNRAHAVARSDGLAVTQVTR